MANKNVILKDESSNNIYPITKIGNLLNDDGTQVSVATEDEINILENRIDEISETVNNPIVKTFGTFSDNRWIINGEDLPVTDLLNVPFSSPDNILKLLITVVAKEDDNNAPEREQTFNITPGFNGMVNISLCWPYEHGSLEVETTDGSNSAIYNLKFHTFIQNGILKTEISDYAFESVNYGKDLDTMKITKYVLVYFRDL